jgi:heat shock protein HtpX
MNADSGADNPHLTPASPPGSAPAVVLAWGIVAVPLIVLGLVVAVVVPGISWWAGLFVGAVAALIVILLRLRSGTGRLLDALGAEEATEDAYARYFNLVEGLALAGGIGQPDLYVVTDSACNAAAVAHRGQTAVIMTTGMLDSLDRIALEGVVAEALVRIGSGDAAAATLASSLYGPLLGGPLGPITRPLARRGMGLLLGPDRDLAADRAAVTLTRYPPGLLAALSTARTGTPVPSRRSATTDHLWLVPPTSVDRAAEPVVAAAPLDLRIDVLGEL